MLSRIYIFSQESHAHASKHWNHSSSVSVQWQLHGFTNALQGTPKVACVECVVIEINAKTHRNIYAVDAIRNLLHNSTSTVTMECLLNSCIV
uniref:Uncharacterized protein n=1 Tax=Glossina palpalis gambiensis TaxID=67801 RepID=A0A1B0AWI7_9MUSC